MDEYDEVVDDDYGAGDYYDGGGGAGYYGGEDDVVEEEYQGSGAAAAEEEADVDADEEQAVEEDYVDESKEKDASTTKAGSKTAAAELPTASATQPKVSFEQTQQQPQEDAHHPRSSAFSSSANSMCCPNCGGKDIEFDVAAGNSVCTACGVVVEENAIVSSLEFVENSAGAASMVGQFVSATSSKAYTSSRRGGGGGGGGGGHFGYSRESREQTLANARRKIQDVAVRMRLANNPFVDSAHRLYTVAVEKNFVQGRKSLHVVACCLYIACRQERSQHMLIDFSDALQVNVYLLGTCFLKFRRLLGLKLDLIDPALYIYRFAAHLELDDAVNAVSLTALRLVGRMQRDWIVTGRRPAGICAAALLIAARAHGLDKDRSDVTRILRVCGMTVHSRIKEFENTAAASLTLDQFTKVDLQHESDPPIYTRNKLAEARATAIANGDVDLLLSGALDDTQASSESQASSWRRSAQQRLKDKKRHFFELYQQLENELKHGKGDATLDSVAVGETTTIVADSGEAAVAAGGVGQIPDALAQQPAAVAETQEKNVDVENVDDATVSKSAALVAFPDLTKADGTLTNSRLALVVHKGDTLAPVPAGWERAYPKSKKGKALILPTAATLEELQPAIAPVEAKLTLKGWKEEMPPDMCSELESLFRSEQEEQQKEAIFNKLNKDYIEQQRRKDLEAEESAANAKDQQDDIAAQVEGQARYKGRKRGRPSGMDANGVDYSNLSTEEQLRVAMMNKRVSRKINYDALSSIFDDSGSFASAAQVTADDGLDAAAPPDPLLA